MRVDNRRTNIYRSVLYRYPHRTIELINYQGIGFEQLAIAYNIISIDL